MNRRSSLTASFLGPAFLALAASPAAAHHLMGGRLPTTFLEGVLSGLGHPIIGLDHLAAVLAVGCLAALHRAGAGLVIAYVAAMMAGVALHVQGVGLPATEAMVALSVIVLGAVLVASRPLAAGAALGLFAVVGLVHGYALGESIYGAEPSPLIAYFTGLAVIQSAIGLGAMALARMIVDPVARELSPVRLMGAGIVGVGLAVLVPQLIPGG